MLFPNRATYQNIEFVRQVYIAAATALTRVLPVLLAEYGSEDANISPENLKGALGQLTRMSRMVVEQGKFMTRPFWRHVLTCFVSASAMFTEEARALQLIQPSQDSSSSMPPASITHPPPNLKINEENISLINPCLESLAIERALVNHPEVNRVMESELRRIRADRDKR